MEGDHTWRQTDEDNAILMRLSTNGFNEPLMNHIENGLTPLHVASAKGHFSAAERLLRESAEVDRETPLGWTPLMYAARNGHLAIVNILLKNGANVSHTNKLGASVLNAAAANGCTAVIDVILNALPEIQPIAHLEIICPHLTAVLYGNLHVIELLSKKGISHLQANFSDERGVSLLMIAAAKNDVALSNYLLQNKTNYHHRTPSSHSMRQETTTAHLRGKSSRASVLMASDLVEQYGWSLPRNPESRLQTKHGSASGAIQGPELQNTPLPSRELPKEEGWSPAVYPVPVPPVSPYSESIYGFSYPPMASQNHSFRLNHSFDQSFVAGCDLKKRAGLVGGIMKFQQDEITAQNLHFQQWWNRKIPYRPNEALGPANLSSLQNERDCERTPIFAGEPSSSAEMDGMMKSSFIVHSLPKCCVHQLSSTHFSLTNVLQNLNLDNYISLFANQEIDMDTFLTLNHQELQEIGITSPKSRNKILRVIAAFREQEHS